MDRSTKADRVPHFVSGDAVITTEKIALNRLPRTQHARPHCERPNLHVEWRVRQNRRCSERRIDRVHQLLISEARAVHEHALVPIQSEYSGWNIDLVAIVRQAVRGSDSVGIVVAESDESLHVIAEIVIQSRGQHIFAEVSALQAGLIESAEIVRVRQKKVSVVHRRQTVLLGALARNEQKRLVFNDRAAPAESILLPAVIRTARRKASKTEELVPQKAEDISV